MHGTRRHRGPRTAGADLRGSGGRAGIHAATGAIELVISPRPQTAVRLNGEGGHATADVTRRNEDRRPAVVHSDLPRGAARGGSTVPQLSGPVTAPGPQGAVHSHGEHAPPTTGHRLPQVTAQPCRDMDEHHSLAEAHLSVVTAKSPEFARARPQEEHRPVVPLIHRAPPVDHGHARPIALCADPRGHGLARRPETAPGHAPGPQTAVGLHANGLHTVIHDLDPVGFGADLRRCRRGRRVAQAQAIAFASAHAEVLTRCAPDLQRTVRADDRSHPAIVQGGTGKRLHGTVGKQPGRRNRELPLLVDVQRRCHRVAAVCRPHPQAAIRLSSHHRAVHTPLGHTVPVRVRAQTPQTDGFVSVDMLARLGPSPERPQRAISTNGEESTAGKRYPLPRTTQRQSHHRRKEITGMDRIAKRWMERPPHPERSVTPDPHRQRIH